MTIATQIWPDAKGRFGPYGGLAVWLWRYVRVMQHFQSEYDLIVMLQARFLRLSVLLYNWCTLLELSQFSFTCL